MCSAAGTLPGLFVEVESVLLCWFTAVHLSANLILCQSSPLDLGRPDNIARIFDSFSQRRIWNIQPGKFIFKALLRNKWQNFSVLPETQLKKRKKVSVYKMIVYRIFIYLCNKPCSLTCGL